jgi:DNA-binding transcriptional LysR family regulator
VDRLGRLSRFWNWLPHFRAVAETEHLPTAAARVHVTPPALSRTLKLLEEEVGHPLFHRRAGRLVLTSDGRRLLEAVRLAMRAVDDAESHLGEVVVGGPLWVAAGGVSQQRVLRALVALRVTCPTLEPRLLTPDPDRVVDQLWAGELDLAVGSFVKRAPGIGTELLGHERSSVWCGPRHPWFGRTDVAFEEVVRWPFIAPPTEPGGVSPEGWPTDVPRQVAFVVDRIALGVDLCAATELLAVLPDSLAAASPVALHRLPLGDLLPRTPIVAHFTEPMASQGAVGLLLTALRSVPPEERPTPGGGPDRASGPNSG